jgi:hypothetical protein
MTAGRMLMIAASLMVALVVRTGAASDITGKWTALVETPMGTVHYTYDFVAKDGKLTGKIQSDMGSSDVNNGKIEGDKISFVEVLKFDAQEIQITYSGQIASADEIKFTRQVGEFANEQLVAKRAK